MGLKGVTGRISPPGCPRARFRGWHPWLGIGIAVLLMLRVPGAAQVGVWETRAPFPLEATEVAAAAIGDKVYVLGGLTESGSTNRLFIYDAFTDTWQEGASLPIAGGVDHANVAALDGKIYFLGGIRILSGFTTGETYEYDPASNTWGQQAPMPTPRGASGVAALDGRIYVAGGLAAGNSVSNFEAFTPAVNGWIILPPMPTPRDHLTAQAVSGKFYAIAGRHGTDSVANEEYDPATNHWRAFAPIPTARGGLGSGTIGGRIQVFGGEGSSGTPEGTFRQNEEYDPATDTWQALAPMPTPRHGIYGATVEGRRIFVPAGGPRAGAFYSSVHEAYYPRAATPPTINSIVNAASFEPLVAPGSIATLFGANLSSGAQVASRLPLPTQMNTTFVLLQDPGDRFGDDAIFAPLLYVSPTQINFQIPTSDLFFFFVGHAQRQSRDEGGQFTGLPLVEAAPGIFSVAGTGRGQGAIHHANGALTDAANPAAIGEAIEIYCTGLGDLSGAEGLIPHVTIGGRLAEVLFFGNAPGFVGLNQVNVRVPAGITPGPAIPVRLSFRGRTSNEVTIAVR